MSNSYKMNYLHLIIGPMFAGKSTELIRIASRFQLLDKKIIVINHNRDTRYGVKPALRTHDGKVFEPAIFLDELKEIYEEKYELEKIDIIFIDELQFFEDAYEVIIKLLDKDKTVIVSSLIGDFNKNIFGDMVKLIPHAEKITKLNALCSICKDGTEAFFSKRIISEKKQTLVGGSNAYIPVCRKHYRE